MHSWSRLARIEQLRVARSTIGASGSALGLITALSIIVPNSLVAFHWIPVRAGLVSLGMAGFSILAENAGWYPNIGHIGHLGGMTFGALYAFAVMQRQKVTSLLKYLARYYILDTILHVIPV